MTKKILSNSKKSQVGKKLPLKLVKYLDDHGIKHTVFEHRTVYTAIDAAATMKKKLGEIAKALYIKADQDYYVVVLPADNNLDFEKVAKCISQHCEKTVKVVRIPGEKIMHNALKLKDGAMSAFGSLYKLPVIIDQGMAKAKKAVFSSGSFNHSIEMAVKDFIKAEKAIVGSLGVKKKVKAAKITKPKGKKKTGVKNKDAKNKQ